MRKTFLFFAFAVSLVFSCVADLFAAATPGGLFSTLQGFAATYGGWAWLAVIVLSFVAIWIIRATKTQKDDVILDKYVAVAIEYALKVMPADSKIDWVKFVANALGKFSEIYTKTNQLPPDAKLYEKIKQLIETIAREKQIEQLGNSAG